jgi:hypothetical protein
MLLLYTYIPNTLFTSMLRLSGGYAQLLPTGVKHCHVNHTVHIQTLFHFPYVEIISMFKRALVDICESVLLPTSYPALSERISQFLYQAVYTEGYTQRK